VVGRRGSGILAVTLSVALARVGIEHNAKVPWLGMFIVCLSYSAIPALEAAAQIAVGITARRIVRGIIMTPMIVTALATIPPLVIVVTSVIHGDWPNCIGAVML